MTKISSQHILQMMIFSLLIASLMFSSCDALNIDVQMVPSSTPVVAITSTAKPKATATMEPTITPTQAFYLTVPSTSLKGTQIRFWHPWQGDLAWKTAERVVEFNNTNPWGITVSFYAPGGTTMLIESVQQSLQDSTWPNVVVAPSSSLAAWQGQNKNLINLDEYITLSETGLTTEQIADFNPVIWQQDILAERRFGYPLQRDAYVLIYNQSWANDLGSSAPPTTPAQFQNQICSASMALLADDITENDGTGGWIVSNEGGTTLSWLLAFEYDGLPGLYQDQYKFLEASSVRSFRYLRYLFDSECSWNARNPNPYDYFAKRQALVFSAKLSELADLQSAMKFNGSSDQWRILPYPGQEKEEINLVEGQSFGMFAGSAEEQMASWLFMKWMNSPAYQAEIVQYTNSLPVTTSVMDQLSTYKIANPQWTAFIANRDQFSAMPNGAYWHKARSVLSDANWQLYQQNEIENSTLAVTEIFTQVDQIINELIRKE